MTFDEFIMGARELKASDIHLTVGAPTVIRVHGDLQKYQEDLTDQIIHKTILSMLSPELEKIVMEGGDVDFSFELKNGSRQRVNVFHHEGKLAAAIRLLNTEIPDLETLGMPDVLVTLAKLHRGLVLVTGPTGAGKSTSLAAMIQHINENRPCHIITIEDPIEYKYKEAKATIHQREVGRDVRSFDAALRSALREDPDVILIGEMRDYETISLALTAAETGHLVFGTLHTSSAAQTIERIVDVCPSYVREQVRSQLADLIQGVIAQQLIPTADGTGRVAAVEVMIGTDAVKNIIRSNKLAQMETTMQGGLSYGMQTLTEALARLYKAGKITYQACMEYCNNRQDMEKRLLSNA